MSLLAKKTKLKICNQKSKPTQSKNRTSEILEILKEAKQKKFASLPESDVREILSQYKIDAPKSENFTDFEIAEKFAKEVFPNKVVLKISSPDAVHKTELKGIFLNIDSTKKFIEAWKNLEESIKIAKLPAASIQIQEQIGKGVEIILGVHSDPNFGRFVVFGSGGIYAEVFHDTTLRILPSDDFRNMIKETKVGKILHGIRGESPKAVKDLIILYPFSG